MTTISHAEFADRAAVIALWQKTGLLKPYHAPEIEFDKALACPSSTIFVTKDDAQITGTVLAGFEGHRGWIYRLAVDPACQSKGLGSLLLEAAENWLQTEQGIGKIQLMVRADNIDIIGFYKERGYNESDILMLWKQLP